jgi:hypothetical protein
MYAAPVAELTPLAPTIVVVPSDEKATARPKSSSMTPPVFVNVAFGEEDVDHVGSMVTGKRVEAVVWSVISAAPC